MKLEGKICLVTGGSRGIGKSIVRNLIAEGASVVFTYLKNKNSAEKFVKEIGVSSDRLKFHFMDVKDRSSVSKVVKIIGSEMNRLDVLVNNAGINIPEDFDNIKDEDWDNIIETNLKGPFIVSQECLPYLKNSPSSSVINIGSVSGQYGGPRTAHYAASKAGLISLSQVLARFGAKYNIRSNTISAGLISSEMADKGMESQAVKIASKNILLKRFGEQSEVSKVVAFLASEESSYITAQTINVNGGLYF